MLISMLKLLLTNAFIKKELFLQLFVPHVCPYNISTGFERNYFSATKCCCYTENYTFFCSYCSRLKHCLNFKVKKACILVDHIKKILWTFTLLICICTKKLRPHLYGILIV